MCTSLVVAVLRSFSAFSFLFIAYINIFLVPYTLTHLQHVVGFGADFTVASVMLGISLEQLLAWMWAFNWAVLIIALLLNIFFIFRKQCLNLLFTFNQ